MAAKEKSKDKTKGKAGKQGSAGKGADARAAGSGGESAGGLSLAAHPRAVRAVAQAKAWGGLGGFVLGGYLSLPTHSAVEAGLRALTAGVVCYVVVWAAAVFVWRRLVVAELRHAQHELLRSELAKLQSADPTAAAAVERRGAPAGR
ncbi:MAG TPA: hypothetical protein VK756_06280 [Solirubrobacteraceae bacterium]|nr:hypothetical protein [Solirubrobacteraceae bacterium]